jgi:diguanylate cyclase (GGDEF)-like protein/PAS domain S-box-containing protein
MGLMRFAFLQRHSIKARVTLFTLAMFVLSLVALSLFASHELRTDMQQQIRQQQRSALSLLSEFVSQGLTIRLQALEKSAQRITPALMDDPAALQAELNKQVMLGGLFNTDLLVMNREGTAIAESSFVPDRLGTNYLDRMHIRLALQHNRSAIGQPVIGRISKRFGFGMSAPIRGAQGQAIGVLTGYIDLGQANFLDTISQQKYGETGGYLLIDPRQRHIITATDKSRILEQLPAPGINPDIDDLLAGAEDTRVMRNPQGVEVLASDKTLDTVGWVLSVVQPIDEAFAPIRTMKLRMFHATLLLTLLAGGLTWWLLRRQLNPLLNTVNVLADRAHNPQALAPLSVSRQDEIGLLINSFNALLANIEQQQRLLTSQQAMLVRAEAVAHLGSWEWDLATNKIFWSDELFRIFQLEPADTAPPFEAQDRLFPPADMQRLREAVDAARTQHTPFELELNALRPDGSSRVCIARCQIELDASQQACTLYGSFQDVTEIKHAQLKLELAAKVFSHAYEGITITNAEGSILDVNDTFSHITGYSRDEVLGQNPRLLKSGRQDLAFYEAMWQQLITDGHWSGELWNRRKNGELYPALLNISAVRDAQGITRQYVGLFSDITVRKAMEAQVRQLAFFDALTALPNRRLLSDRLGQTLLANQRSGRYGALMFLDLDNFKPLNDTHGHAVGDLLLIEVASRLRACVRQMDTVARIGGDEFVVMLSDLDADARTSLAQASAIAEKIRLSLAKPYSLRLSLAGQDSRTVEHHCTSSIGVVLMAPDCGDMESPLKQADAAMYQAKVNGRNRVVFGPSP